MRRAKGHKERSDNETGAHPLEAAAPSAPPASPPFSPGPAGASLAPAAAAAGAAAAEARALGPAPPIPEDAPTCVASWSWEENMQRKA